jgi:hypothetical protein
MQPYFFAYIGYWQLIHAVDRFVILDNVNYIKRGWVNRNRILINNEARYITVPLQHASQNRRICDTYLQYSPLWRNKLVKMVEFTYRKASHFDDVFPVIKNIIQHETDNLSEYLMYQLETLAKFLGMNADFVLASHSYENCDLNGRERILHICKCEGAAIYINPQGGEALYSKAEFLQNGLDLKFLIPSATEYKQFCSTHLPWLSIIDVLMFNGFVGTKKLLQNFSLKPVN